MKRAYALSKLPSFKKGNCGHNQQKIETNNSFLPKQRSSTIVDAPLYSVSTVEVETGAKQKPEFCDFSYTEGTPTPATQLSKQQFGRVNPTKESNAIQEFLVELTAGIPLPLRISEVAIQYQPKRHFNGKSPVILRWPDQVARLIMNLSKGLLIGAPINNNAIVVCFQETAASGGEWKRVINELMTTFSTKLSITSERVHHDASNIHPSTLLDTIQFTISSKLLLTGHWIYHGDSVHNLIGSGVLNSASDESSFITAPSLRFACKTAKLKTETKESATFTILVKLNASVYKVLPLMKAERNRVVYCLPRCAIQAVVEKSMTEPPQSKFLRTISDYQKYWLLQHGYVLSVGENGPLRQFVEVCMSGCIRLSYPIGTVWKEQAFLMPQLSAIASASIALKSLPEFSQISLFPGYNFEIEKHNITLEQGDLQQRTRLERPLTSSPTAKWLCGDQIEAHRATQQSFADYVISKSNKPLVDSDKVQSCPTSLKLPFPNSWNALTQTTVATQSYQINSASAGIIDEDNNKDLHIPGKELLDGIRKSTSKTKRKQTKKT